MRVLATLGGLYVFAISVTLMGSSFKLMGRDAAEAILRWADNPFLGLLVGLLMTSLVQSSSTVTTMIVTAVAGGLVPLHVAVPMVMGANIGTTVTNTLVALGSVVRSEEFRRSIAAATVHDFFNLLSVALLLPVEVAVQATGFLRSVGGHAIGPLGWVGDRVAHLVPASGVVVGVEKSQSGFGFIFKGPATWVLDRIAVLVSGGAHDGAKALSRAADSPGAADGLGTVVVWVGVLGVVAGLLLLSLCLVVIAKNMRVLVLGRLEGALTARLLRHGPTCVALGVIVTVLVQSSSITTSILVPVAAAGLLGLRQVFMVTLGANIGTTCTGLLAALFLVTSGDAGARLGLGIACVHLAFNIAGMSLFLSIPFLREIPIKAATRFSGMCVKRKLHAVTYLIGVFFALPMALLLLFRLGQAVWS